MAAPREFDVAIIGKGPLRKIVLDRVGFSDFIAAIEAKFGLSPHELNCLELRRVDEEPAPSNASPLFEAAAESPIELTKHLIADGVQYIVGKIGAESAGAWFASLHRLSGLRCGGVSSSGRRRWRRAAPLWFNDRAPTLFATAALILSHAPHTSCLMLAGGAAVVTASGDAGGELPPVRVC